MTHASLESLVEAALATQVVEGLFDTKRFNPPRSVGPDQRYRLLGLVGGGSSGSVFTAIDEMYSDDHHKEVVAVKLLRGDESADEARKARYVRHQNVVRSLDFGDDFVVFQFVGGGSLADTTRPMDPWRAASLMAEVADGVQAAHSQGLVHRDLKPANVLLDEDGTPKVADFGIAVRPTDLTAMIGDSTQPTGNRAFMAPELVTQGRSAISVQVDVYALGAMLLWLLTDLLPKDQAVQDETAGSDTPADLRAICRRAMNTDVNQRYKSAAEFSADLRCFLQLQPLEWTNPSLRKRAALAWRRDPRIACLGALTVSVFVASAAGVGWFYDTYKQAEVLDEQRRMEVKPALDALEGFAALIEAFTQESNSTESPPSQEPPQPAGTISVDEIDR